MRLILAALASYLMLEARGQAGVVKGRVTDSLGRPLQDVTVLLNVLNEALPRSYGLTSINGEFAIRWAEVGVGGILQLEFRHIAFGTEKVLLDSSAFERKEPFQIIMRPLVTNLKEIVIIREPPVTIRSDTISFQAGHFRKEDVRKLDDLLMRIPGFTSDDNGRLSFNGRKVGKVLIEGDDLAGDSYTLLTRNLDARWVDKVEVVDNFNENRLRRGVENSDKVGVNIRIAPDKKLKPSATIEGGSSPDGRYQGEMSGLLIQAKSNWIGFANTNNVARDPSGNVGFYHKREGGFVASENEEDLELPSVLETGAILFPGVGDQYTNDNRDQGLALMNSWRQGSAFKMNMLAGASKRNLQREARSEFTTGITGMDEWTTLNEIKSSYRNRDLLLGLSAIYDRGGAYLSGFRFAFRSAQHQDRFKNLASGGVSDSLIEQIRNTGRALSFGWDQTLKSKGKVWQLRVHWSASSGSQDFTSRSARYQGYFGLDSSYNMGSNLYRLGRKTGRAEFNVAGKSLRLRYEAAIVGQILKAAHSSDMRITSYWQAGNDFRKEVQSDPDLIDVRALVKGSLPIRKKTELALQAIMGMQNLRHVDIRHQGYLVYDASVMMSHRFSMTSRLRIAFRQERSFDEFGQLHPGGMLSGNAVILNGINFGGPGESSAMDISFHRNDLQRQRSFSLSGAINYHHVGYTSDTELSPELAIQGQALSSGNYSAHAALSAEFFVAKLKGRTGSSFFVSHSGNATTLNMLKGRAESGIISLSAWWNTGFKSPLNLELRGYLGTSRARWGGGPVNNNYFRRWTAKLKASGERGLYSALVWNIQRLSPQRDFHGLDIYASANLGRGMKATLTGVNLLNQKRLADRNIRPFTVTVSELFLVNRYVMLSFLVPLPGEKKSK